MKKKLDKEESIIENLNDIFKIIETLKGLKYIDGILNNLLANSSVPIFAKKGVESQHS